MRAWEFRERIESGIEINHIRKAAETFSGYVLVRDVGDRFCRFFGVLEDDG